MNNQGFEMNENGGRTYGSTDELQNSPASGGQLPRTRNNNSRNPRDNNGDKHLAIELESQNEPSGLRRSQKKTENNPEVVVDSTSPHVVKHIDLDDDGVTPNIVARIVVGVRRGFYQAVIQNKKKVNIFLVVSTVILYNAFLITSIIYNDNYNQYDQNDDPTDNNKGYYIDWCNGVGILIIITVFVYWCFFYYLILRGLFGKQIKRGILDPIQKIAGPIVGKWYFSYALGLLCLAGAVTFVVVDAQGQEQRLISAGGIVVLLIIGLLLSKNPGRIKWSQVFIGIGLQFVFGLIILRWNTGRQIFDCISQKVKIFLDFTNEGSFFVYGYLAEGVNTTTTMDGIMLPQIFVFKSLSVIFFFSFFISLLYHYGAMMWVITKLGWFLQVTIGTTAAESMNAAANIFIGQTEAPILIKPFLNDMTKSELHAVMVGGFSTIAGSVMGAYISFGIDPSYLLSASIMAAPAALAVSKLFYPETKVSRTTAEQIKSITLKTEGNALDAAAQGAAQGVMLIGNIVANVIAFMAFVAFLNAMVSWIGGLVGLDISFETILGKVFVPAAYLIGVDTQEVEDVALLLGLKTVVNEFVAYGRMVQDMGCLLSPRSRAIATYGLCSFANFSSIGIQLGGIGFMAPHRRTDLAKTIWYAFLAGTFCGLLNACMAGMLISELGYPNLPDGCPIRNT